VFSSHSYIPKQECIQVSELICCRKTLLFVLSKNPNIKFPRDKPYPKNSKIPEETLAPQVRENTRTIEDLR
jgi:hypothetical protein